MQLGLVKVNEKFKLGELSPNAQRFILEVLKIKTRDNYYPNAQINSECTKDLWHKDTELGLRIVRDYYLVTEFVYPMKDRNTGKVGYGMVQLGTLNKGTKKISDGDYCHYIPSIERFNDDELEKIFEEFTSKLNGNYKVVEDYDADAIEEMLECGDIDGILDLVGDRDLAELM